MIQVLNCLQGEVFIVGEDSEVRGSGKVGNSSVEVLRDVAGAERLVCQSVLNEGKNVLDSE